MLGSREISRKMSGEGFDGSQSSKPDQRLRRGDHEDPLSGQSYSGTWESTSRPTEGTANPRGYDRQEAHTLKDHTERADTQTEVESVLERRQRRIEERLRELPTQLPTLVDLPQKRWWNLFIDVPYHEGANKESDPGKFFDNDRSPGYQQSMMEAFNTYIVQKENRQKNLTADDYTELHKCVTKYIRHKEFGGYQHEWMCKPNGISSDNPFTYTRLAKIPEEGPERQERLAALEEMRNHKINDVPLYVDYPNYNVESGEWVVEMDKHSTYEVLEMSCDHGFMHLKNNAPNMDGLLKKLSLGTKPQGIIMGVTSTHDASVGTIPLYSPGEGMEFVDAILKNHNANKSVERERYQIVMDTVETVRDLYVLHPKFDGMRRTNVHLFLNKELLAQGLCPTMLPHGPDVFGGLKTLAGLAEDVVEGMHLYVKTVENAKSQPQEDSLPNGDEHEASATRARHEEFDRQISLMRTDKGKVWLKSHTLACLQSADKKQWLAGTINKLAMVYHGMDIIDKHEENNGFKEMFMENSEQFFKDSPYNEKYGVYTDDSAGKVFMQWHGERFLKSELGKEWLKGKDGKQWKESYSGQVFKTKHEEKLRDLSLEM